VFSAGCETTPKVRSDYDRAANFGDYRTFNFLTPPAAAKSEYSMLLTQLLKSAVTDEMRRRGYTLAEKPGLLVDFWARFRQTQNGESVSGSYYGYPPGLFAPWPGYLNAVQTVGSKGGTLVIDLADAQKRQMVWEGVGVDEFPSAELRDLAGAVNRGVADIFGKYPFQAGRAQPIDAAAGR
jgi:hypothetical protein